MTQLITHAYEGLKGASIIVRAIDVPTTASYDTRMSEVISSNGWPDCYQERIALKPRWMSAITRGCCGELFPGAKRAWPR